MQPTHPPSHVPPAPTNKPTTYLLGGLSIFTMVMTIPQVFTVWISHQTAGVSLLSWSAYLISALVWFWYGIQKRDRNIYLPCIGWIALDAAVVSGVLILG